MGNKEIFSQFNRLEEKIETLVNKCLNLEKDNAELKNKISTLESENENIENSKFESARENEDLKKRIDELLDKLSAFD